MNALCIPTRYPNGLPGTNIPAEFYTKEDAERCIKYAESILKKNNNPFVLDVLERGSTDP
ncbi:MAG: HEPN domain-containing protein [Candidatus Hydrothermarchaeota archaeon]